MTPGVTRADPSALRHPRAAEEYNKSLRLSTTEKFADPGKCEDTHESCEGWHEAGECERNAAYM